MYSCTVSGQSVMGVFASSKAAVNPKAQTLTVSSGAHLRVPEHLLLSSHTGLPFIMVG